MSSKKGYGYKGYKDIDNMDTGDIVPAVEEDFKSNTLDFYSDDMAKKPVSNLFKGMKDTNVEEEKTVSQDSQNIRKGYSRENKNLTPNNVEEVKKIDKLIEKPKKVSRAEYISEEDTANIQPVTHREPKPKSSRPGDRRYNGFSNKDFDYRNTNYATDKIKIAKLEEKEMERNKAALEEIEKNKRIVEKRKQASRAKADGRAPVTGSKSAPTSGSHNVRKKQKMTAYIRIGTICLLAILLLWLTIVTVQKNSIAAEVEKLRADNEKLQTQLTEASGLQLRLQGEIDELKANGNNSSLVVEPETGDADITINSDEVEQEQNNGLPTKHTVVAGDNLSRISAKYYNGDGTQYNKIKEANGMTNDNLVVGQVLTIPE